MLLNVAELLAIEALVEEFFLALIQFYIEFVCDLCKCIVFSRIELLQYPIRDRFRALTFALLGF